MIAPDGVMVCHRPAVFDQGSGTSRLQIAELSDQLGAVTEGVIGEVRCGPVGVYVRQPAGDRARPSGDLSDRCQCVTFDVGVKVRKPVPSDCRLKRVAHDGTRDRMFA